MKVCQHLNTNLLSVIALPNGKILDLFKLKVLADNKMNMTQELKVIFGRI